MLLVAGNDVSYGLRPGTGRSWTEIFAAEVRPRISDADWSRVHFLGHVAYEHFTLLLQLSTVHVYLTYPFVLSWSLMEAMSVGCLIVASDTDPVREQIKHGENGLLVDFFDPAALADTVAQAIEKREELRPLRHAARQHIVKHHDLNTICQPAQMALLSRLVGQPL